MPVRNAASISICTWATLSGGWPRPNGRSKRSAVATSSARRTVWRCSLRRRLTSPAATSATSGRIRRVREKIGGQYTHAASWLVMAFAALGEGDKAVELLRHQPHQSRAHPHQLGAALQAEPCTSSCGSRAAPPDSSDAAAGHGTRARRGGCRPLGVERILGCTSRRLLQMSLFPKHGRNSRCGSPAFRVTSSFTIPTSRSDRFAEIDELGFGAAVATALGR